MKDLAWKIISSQSLTMELLLYSHGSLTDACCHGSEHAQKESPRIYKDARIAPSVHLQKSPTLEMWKATLLSLAALLSAVHGGKSW